MRLFCKRRQLGYKLLLTMNGKLYMDCRMTYLHLTLAHSIGEDSGHAYLTYLGNGYRFRRNTIDIK